MTPAQKAIIKKYGGEPKIKGSALWRKFHEPEKVKQESHAIRKDINKAMSKYKEPSEKEKSDYQRSTGRGYNE